MMMKWGHMHTHHLRTEKRTIYYRHYTNKNIYNYHSVLSGNVALNWVIAVLGGGDEPVLPFRRLRKKK